MSVRSRGGVAPVSPQPIAQFKGVTIGLMVVLATLVSGVAIWIGTGHEGQALSTGPDQSLQLATEAEESEAPLDADDEVALPTVSYELFLGRDPFEPVVPEPEPEPVEPGDPAAPVDPDDPDAPFDPSDPSAPDSPIAGNGTTQDRCTSGTEVVCDGRVITVQEVYEVNGDLAAVLQVDTMRYEVRPGDVVLDSFEIISISPDEVRILFGDRVVTVLVGDNALK